MKTYLKLVFLFPIGLSACSDPLFREAVYRGISEAYYQRSLNPYVSPLGRASETFAAGFFGTLADAQKQQRIIQEWQERDRQAGETYGAQIYGTPGVHQEEIGMKVVKLRAEIEELLKEDRALFSEWIHFLPQWIDLLERAGANRPKHPDRDHYLLSKTLLEDTLLLNGRAAYYLANLPAYIHENMNVERARTEIQDYFTKKNALIETQSKHIEYVNVLNELAKKERERLKQIEVKTKTF